MIALGRSLAAGGGGGQCGEDKYWEAGCTGQTARGSGGRFRRRDLVKSLEPKVEDEKTGRAGGSSRTP